MLCRLGHLSGLCPQAWRPFSSAVACCKIACSLLTLQCTELHFSCRAVNGGNYVMLPTSGSIAMFEGWSAAAHDGIKEGQHDQQFLDRIWERIFRRCLSRDSCEHVRGEVSGGASGCTACWTRRT